ncbi:MAG: ABC transporter ATP-binding protein, partial [Candidatus Thorarchaeota archaeon]|nr:ABC transporter ATP-binding protein [Candidatus Thorarchaeota archaeon]
MIILEDVHYSYDSVYTALRGISLQVDDGERLAVIGANGAGKTTMIKHMNGLLRPQKGRVILDGQDTKFMSVAEIAREVGLVFQNPDHQLFLDSVKKEVEFGLRNIGFTE